MQRHEVLEKLGAVERALPVPRKLEEAQKAYEEAKAHKRAQHLHQMERRAAMRRFDLFKADLEAMGIQVIIEPTQTSQHIPKGGNSRD
jgi:hypothetical protein